MMYCLILSTYITYENDIKMVALLKQAFPLLRRITRAVIVGRYFDAYAVKNNMDVNT